MTVIFTIAVSRKRNPMSTSNPINLYNLDGRYTKPTDVTTAIAAQASTDAGQYAITYKDENFIKHILLMVTVLYSKYHHSSPIR